MTDLPSAAARDLVPGAAATLALVTALTANALTGTAAGQTLRDPAPGSARVRLWSDPGTWPAGVLPGPNTDVFIPAGRTVWLDFAHLGARVDVRSITVQGELRVAFGGGALEANYVLVDGGTFGVGTPERRYPAPVRITLTHDPARTNYGSATNPGDMLDQALVVQNGGALELHGIDHGTSWTQLAETAFAGDTQIRLTEPVDWLPGHEIVLASTDFDLDQAETANVLQVTGDVVQLSAPLQHMHWGQIEGPYANGMSVDERGEVGLLSRSIVVEGTPFVAPDGRTMGGHTMVHRGPNGFSGPAPRMDVSWVEFTGLGREGTLGRYPLHAHLASSLPDTRFHACSVRNSFNRVVSIHSVLDVEVTDCVAHEHIGHGYYFEGLGGVRNVMNGNLGLGTRSAAPGREILTSDLEPGTFWLENPLNEIRDNVAAGSEHFGFWWEPSDISTVDPDFDGSVAHSNGAIGIYQDVRPRPPTGLIEDLTLYKNREHALWWRTYGRMTFRDVKLADNRAGTYLASEGVQIDDGFSFIQLEDSLVVGETANVGEPTRGIERAHGRSLPQVTPFLHGSLGAEWDALVGVEMYDGAFRIVNTHFAHFADAFATCLPPECASPAVFQREAGALSNVYYHNPWSFLPTNSVAGLSFESADAVWLRTPVGAPLTDNGIANTVFIDEDGSVTGTPMTYVRPRNTFLDHQPAANEAFRPAWNATSMEMYQPDGPGGQTVPYLYGLLQWQHAFAAAPLVDSALVERVPLDGTLAPRTLELFNATCNQNPYSLMPTALVTGAAYSFDAPGLAPSAWPAAFNLRWGGTAPGEFVVVSFPYPSGTATVRFDGVVDGAQAAGPAALAASPGSDHYLDAAAGRLYLKLVAGGSGGSVWDGEMLRVDVD